jgi:hypothetical protein
MSAPVARAALAAAIGAGGDAPPAAAKEKEKRPWHRYRAAV